MSGEGLSVSFRRTSMTQMSNQELLEEFQKIVYESRVTKHMKWYGQAHSVYMEEHGDEELQKWQQEGVAIKDTFRFCISVYESWYEDADLYESHSLQDSFVSLAREFAKDNWLHYYSEGFPSEWIETETIDGEKHWNHFVVKPDDKNIDKICKIWHNYGQQMVRAEQFGQTQKMKSSYWEQAKNDIKSIMEHKHEYSS
tara:strand:- start:2718 stop:3311 length:594 start_codon:yes stop_codon:yes gene_type:complete